MPGSTASMAPVRWCSASPRGRPRMCASCRMGTLISVRNDPVRVAEEYATADVISRGRLEIGFVKSGDSEMASGNANPIGIRRAVLGGDRPDQAGLTHQDGPVRWEGKHFTHRHINIWPRPYQQPHPPMWAATGDPATSRRDSAGAAMVNAWCCAGSEVTQARLGRLQRGAARGGAARRRHRPIRLLRRFVYVGDTDEEGRRGRSQDCCGSSTPASSRRRSMSKFLPGRNPPELAPQLYCAQARRQAPWPPG